LWKQGVIKGGDEILSTDHEYGACKRSWTEYCVNKGANWVEAKIPIPAPSKKAICEIIWSQVTPKTKILFLSHLTSPTAIVLPVEELCRRAKKAGILTFIDGAHIPAHIDLDLEGL
jgi:isopenicillin-N epimerase